MNEAEWLYHKGDRCIKLKGDVAYRWVSKPLDQRYARQPSVAIPARPFRAAMKQASTLVLFDMTNWHGYRFLFARSSVWAKPWGNRLGEFVVVKLALADEFWAGEGETITAKAAVRA